VDKVTGICNDRAGEKMSFSASLEIGGTGLSVTEFCALTDIITKRHGKKVMIAECDKGGKMHFSKDETGSITGFEYHQHLGYIDINTSSLVWDPVMK